MLSPTTELDAINVMLSAIGESPVNSVEDSGVVDAVMARNILRQTLREVQARGWHFNTEKDYRLTPTFPEKQLVVPRNVLRVDTVGQYQSIDVVVRGNRLYDRRNHTFTFGHPVTVDMIILLPFDQVPEMARQYVTIRSARIFQERVVGSVELSTFAAKDEMQALIDLQEYEADTADYNIFNVYSVARVLDR
ncbi:MULTISPECIES: tail tubular protein A [unclassified Thioalkalivibrio]|uniref:tail tubular protein A n=1 Tax=unclassified Thioalkalivibrio TaxID=2621013 RepID=UPI0003638FDB|nr:MULTISPECIES: tail tubular protein A [unclassified Thioalkalivibrio]